MKKLFQKIIFIFKKRRPTCTGRKLNPESPEEREELIRQAVRRTVKEYGEALKRLSSD